MPSSLFLRLNPAGSDLYSDICKNPGQRIYNFHVTSRQVEMILSIQDRISKTEDNQWKVSGKKRQGGHLDLEKLRNRFFGSKK